MARYRPYIEAVQWTGTNLDEVEQFVTEHSDSITGGTVEGTVLTLTSPLGIIPGETVAVQADQWVICQNRHVRIMTPEEFAALYELNT